MTVTGHVRQILRLSQVGHVHGVEKRAIPNAILLSPEVAQPCI